MILVSRPILNILFNYIWTLMLNHFIHLSKSYTKVYMMTNSVFYIESLYVHLTGSPSKGIVDLCGFLEQTKNLKLSWRCSVGVWYMEIQNRRNGKFGFKHCKWFLPLSAQNLVNFFPSLFFFGGGGVGILSGATFGFSRTLWMTVSSEFTMLCHIVW
jgi:hypothetical protein